MSDERLPKQISKEERQVENRSQGGQKKRYKDTLTDLCRVDSSTLTLWTGPFPM